MPASGSKQTPQITLSPWVGIQLDLNLIQHIISCCTLFVARHLALTAAFSHFALCDTLPFGRLWYGEPNAITNAVGYAMHYSRSHDAVIRVYDDTYLPGGLRYSKMCLLAT